MQFRATASTRLWQEVQIVFTKIPPQQFFSDNQILAAADAGQIALDPTS